MLHHDSQADYTRLSCQDLKAIVIVSLLTCDGSQNVSRHYFGTFF